MKKVGSILQLIWLRLKSRTPAFFRAWGVFLGVLTATAAYLNAEMLDGRLPEGLERKHVLWVNFIVFLFGTITPLLATKDKELQGVKTDSDLVRYKENKQEIYSPR